MWEYGLIFLGGMTGSFHCLGMCGGFVLGLNARAPNPHAVCPSHHLLYHVGRLVSYTFLGALVGFLGVWLIRERGLAAFQMGLALLGGLAMIAIGLHILGLLRSIRILGLRAEETVLARILVHFVSQRGPTPALSLGLFTGFLPCPLVYAFLAKAGSTGAVLPGMATMASFGLGTFPVLLLLGVAGKLLTPARRGVLFRSSGLVVLVLGIITLARGLWLTGLTPGLAHGH